MGGGGRAEQGGRGRGGTIQVGGGRREQGGQWDLSHACAGVPPDCPRRTHLHQADLQHQVGLQEPEARFIVLGQLQLAAGAGRGVDVALDTLVVHLLHALGWPRDTPLVLRTHKPHTHKQAVSSLQAVRHRTAVIAVEVHPPMPQLRPNPRRPQPKEAPT